MKTTITFLVIVLSLSCFSEIQKPIFDLANIEASHAYQENIKALEAELKHPHDNKKELLLIQLALINNYVNISAFDKATALCQKEIIIAKKNNLPFNEASLYVALGRVYYFLNQIEKVSQYNLECLKLAEEHQYLELLKKCNHNLGVIAFENKNDYRLAESYFLKAIEYGKQLPETKQINLGKNYRLLATTYDVQGRYRLSDSVFKITTAIFKKFNDSLGIAEALTFHARLSVSQKKYDNASLLCNEAITIARLIHNDDYLQTSLSILERINIETTNYKEAYTIKSEIFQLELAKNKVAQQKNIAESEVKFRVAEIEAEQELNELKVNQSKQLYFYTFIVLFLASISAIIFIYQKRNAKKEATIKLESLKKVYEAEEKERTRIAKDLHDNMGAYTTSILAQIDALEYSRNEVAIEKIDDLRNDAEHIMATLRETIWVLKNKTINSKQLFDLIRIYADKHLVKNLNISVFYIQEIEIDKSHSPSVSLNIYRITQEIIQNIIKHAQAREVIIKLTCHQHFILEITDNGKGFNIDSIVNKSGLENMEHRANDIGFQIQIKSEINAGTKIKILDSEY